MTKALMERTGDSLCSVVDLWEIVSNTLGITTKQAAEFVEQKFKAFELVLWVDNKYTGLWEPCEGNNAFAVRKDLSYLMDAWNSGESGSWSPASLQQWKFLKLTHQGFLVVVKAAQDIKKPETVNEDDLSLVQIHEEIDVKQDIDPSDLPEELQAANIAFRAVTNGYGDPSATFRNRLVDYLKNNFSALKNDAVERIASVANPDKTPGRKKHNAE